MNLNQVEYSDKCEESVIISTHRGLVEVAYYYRGADKSLARSTSRCILFDGENISFDASLVTHTHTHIYIYI